MLMAAKQTTKEMQPADKNMCISEVHQSLYQIETLTYSTIMFIFRYTGLKNPRAFQASSGDTHKLKRLVESIKDMTELVKTSTLILRTNGIDEDEDSSGSGTSGGS